MGKTKVEWTEITWKPVTGCDKVAQGLRQLLCRDHRGTVPRPTGIPERF